MFTIFMTFAKFMAFLMTVDADILCNASSAVARSPNHIHPLSQHDFVFEGTKPYSPKYTRNIPCQQSTSQAMNPQAAPHCAGMPERTPQGGGTLKCAGGMR